MRACVVIAPGSTGTIRARERVQLDFHGVPVHFGIIDVPAPAFDPDAAEHAHHVLLRVQAFSFNYREKGRFLKVAANASARGYAVLGSEFAGTVLQVGSAVTDLAPGDMVCGNGSVAGGPGYIGLTTERASAELQVMHEAKLLRLPSRMGPAVGAAFSVGGQTAYGMVRRLAPAPGSHVLVTAATSNTSLFAIRALLNRGVVVHALTTSAQAVPYLRALGATRCCVLDRDGDYEAVLREYLKEQGLRGFDRVIDPFMDVYLRKLISFVNRLGVYITCGVFSQGPQVRDDFMYRGVSLEEIFGQLIRKSISLVGNNLGTTEDLMAALDDYQTGRLPVDVDTVVTDGALSTFIERTFLESGRRGKVVFQYRQEV